MSELTLSKQGTVVLAVFLVAITPSLSDMVQIELAAPGSYRYVLVWYAVLLCVLWALWEVFL